MYSNFHDRKQNMATGQSVNIKEGHSSSAKVTCKRGSMDHPLRCKLFQSFSVTFNVKQALICQFCNYPCLYCLLNIVKYDCKSLRTG